MSSKDDKKDKKEKDSKDKEKETEQARKQTLVTTKSSPVISPAPAHTGM